MNDTTRPGPPRPPSKHVLLRRWGYFPGRLRMDKLVDPQAVRDAVERLLDDLDEA